MEYPRQILWYEAFIRNNRNLNIWNSLLFQTCYFSFSYQIQINSSELSVITFVLAGPNSILQALVVMLCKTDVDSFYASKADISSMFCHDITKSPWLYSQCPAFYPAVIKAVQYNSLQRQLIPNNDRLDISEIFLKGP